MRLNRFIYVTDEFFDFGCAGEHPVTFIYSASVDYEGGSKQKNVTIWSAVATVEFGEQLQHWDITKKILESTADKEAWEEELFRDYINNAASGYEEGA